MILKCLLSLCFLVQLFHKGEVFRPITERNASYQEPLLLVETLCLRLILSAGNLMFGNSKASQHTHYLNLFRDPNFSRMYIYIFHNHV